MTIIVPIIKLGHRYFNNAMVNAFVVIIIASVYSAIYRYNATVRHRFFYHEPQKFQGVRRKSKTKTRFLPLKFE